MKARYTRTAISLHWLMALGIIGTFALGTYMHELPLSPTKLQLYSWHKWAGVTLFMLLILRLAWRIAHPAPPLPATMPAAMRLAANAAHWVLYALMIMIPLSGWLMSSAKGFQTVWFGVLPLPDLVAKDKALGDLLQEVHEALNFTLLAILVAHVGAALKHHFIDRDDVLTRMLPAADKT
ncbi:MAG: cytochrome b [Proteobacteria bacterium]|nr:cytochrome b [Pseudomonadota bacterium]MBS0555614.1 cytochrome b [Pseudomonadota bacterium]